MKTLGSIVIWALWAVWIISFTLIVFLVWLVTWPFDSMNRIPNRTLKGLAWIMFHSVPGWTVQVNGSDPGKVSDPVVVVANHQSFLDIPLAFFLPWDMKWVAKKSLFYIPFLGWIIWMTGHLSIDRSSKKAGLKLQNLVDPISNGTPAMFFPEGTRSRDGTLQPFKYGAFNLAKKHNFKVLPIVLNGGYDAMPRGSWRFRMNQHFTLSVLDPVDPADYEQVDDLRKESYHRIKSELHRIQKRDK